MHLVGTIFSGGLIHRQKQTDFFESSFSISGVVTAVKQSNCSSDKPAGGFRPIRSQFICKQLLITNEVVCFFTSPQLCPAYIGEPPPGGVSGWRTDDRMQVCSLPVCVWC